MDRRCPRKLRKMPCEGCPEGRKAMDLARQGKVGGCPWFIADAESHYCFFKYMADNGQSVPTHRIAHLLMIDDRDIKKVIQGFRRRITTLFDVDKIEDFFDA